MNTGLILIDSNDNINSYRILADRNKSPLRWANE